MRCRIGARLFSYSTFLKKPGLQIESRLVKWATVVFRSTTTATTLLFSPVPTICNNRLVRTLLLNNVFELWIGVYHSFFRKCILYLILRTEFHCWYQLIAKYALLANYLIHNKLLFEGKTAGPINEHWEVIFSYFFKDLRLKKDLFHVHYNAKCNLGGNGYQYLTWVSCGLISNMAANGCAECELPIYVVNAFTDKPFCGNPAAICLPGHEVLCGF